MNALQFILSFFIGVMLAGSILYLIKVLCRDPRKEMRIVSILLGAVAGVLLAWGVVATIELVYCCSRNELSMMEQGYEGNMPTAYQSWAEEGRVIIH